MAGSERQSFLLLLNRPLDTVEGVQEVTESDHLPIYVDDIAILRRHFPEDFCNVSATLLDASAASAVEEWAQRHSAVYKLNMTSISTIQAQDIVHAAQHIEWPCWVFVYGKLAEANELAGALEVSETDIEMALGKLSGYAYRDASVNSAIKRTSPAASTASAKLRPAQDVLNRLRHDANFLEADYQVVYEDRFEGKIVLDLELWRTDVSDEEFIPMHRILQFKRKWDDVIIWDRASRIDLLFESNNNAFVEGLAVKIVSAAQLSSLRARAPESSSILPCVLELADIGNGTVKAWTFR